MATVCLSGMLIFTGNAQGLIAFRNRNTSPEVYAPVTHGVTGAGLAGTEWTAQFYYSPDPSPTMALRATLPVTHFLTGVGAGYTVPVRVVLDDVPIREIIAYEMRVWNTAAGGSYEEALANPLGVVGRSKRLLISIAVNETYLTTLEPFEVLPVSEPAPWILLALGGILLMRCKAEYMRPDRTR